MAKGNPYDCDNPPGKFEIGYAGHEAGFYCFTVDLTGKGLDPLMFEMELSEWLFANPQGRWHMGNDFPYADHPKLTLVAGKTETLVLFEQMADVALFERAFQINGLTPTMLV